MRSRDSNSLVDRLNKSYDDKDKGGATVSAFDWKKSGRKEVTFFKVNKEGKFYINIVPFKIKSKNHPLVRTKDFNIGDPDYLFDVWIHKSIGSPSTDIICPKSTFGKPCPVCELAEKYKNEGKEKEYKSLKPKRTVLYNVIDTKNPDKGMQVFIASHYLFEKPLIDEARNASDDGEMIDFPNIKKGKVVYFRSVPAKIDGKEYYEFSSFKFIDRDEKLDSSLIDKAISFDSIMKLYSYEEIEKILYSGEGDSDDDDEDSKPKKNNKHSDEDDEEEGDNNSDDDDNEEDEDEEAEDENKDEEEEDDSEENDDNDSEEKDDDDSDEEDEEMDEEEGTEENDEEDDDEESDDSDDDEEEEKPKAKAKPAPRGKTAKAPAKKSTKAPVKKAKGKLQRRK